VAYLLGFWLAESPVSWWCGIPEARRGSRWCCRLSDIRTLFSMYRRKFIQGQSPGQPDRMHMHQVIFMRLTRARTERLPTSVR